MYTLIENVKLCLSASSLFIASWYDLKFREIPDKLWMVSAPIGLLLTLIQAFIYDSRLLQTLAISVIVVSAISVTVFYLGLFGGADAKALVTLSLTMPTPPSLLNGMGKALPLFTVTVFNNAILTSALLSIALLTYNLLWKALTKSDLFEGLESEPSHRKFIVLITGYKVKAEKLLEKKFIYPLEEVEIGDREEIVRRITLSVRIEDDEDVNRRIDTLKNLNGYVWISPALPFLIFITIGFFTSLIVGDMILILVKAVFT